MKAPDDSAAARAKYRSENEVEVNALVGLGVIDNKRGKVVLRMLDELFDECWYQSVSDRVDTARDLCPIYGF